MRRWLERQKYLVDFTLSSLSRRKWKNAVLLTVYALIVFALASVLSLHARAPDGGGLRAPTRSWFSDSRRVVMI